ncbi:RES family NAD+ phosphorylase [Arenimonas daejeonensis]|uniref:RES family NAD+ phosphorylase n=1 Tax=Arenimonas daejeonensis TaxID=370777 RepID=UPI0013158F84|nr:RES family NAD+ phosphorylase [Arenimonas daejeonensis]
MQSSAAVMNPPPRAEPPAPISLERSMQDVLSVESDFVAKFLPYQAMTRMPRGYEEFAQWHFRRLEADGLRWQDAAPAYALACLSHSAYGAELDPSVEWELELQWGDLRRLSKLPWEKAQPLIRAGWEFLSGKDGFADVDRGVVAMLADGSARHEPPYPFEDEDEEPGARLDTEMVPAYVVLRESLAAKAPDTWRTRGQERWLSADVPAICLALSPALAALEAVTWQGFLDDEPRFLVRVAFPYSLLRALDPTLDAEPERRTTPGERRANDRRADAPRQGDRWARERRSALLQVPSALCPGEFNVLANLAHPDFAQVQKLDAMPLSMDRRQRRH